jgi:quinolinate synthase
MIQNATELYTKLKDVKIGGNICKFSEEKCAALFPIVAEIQQLKREKNAIVLAHSYVSPEIQVAVADFVGDSYELSKWAKETKADTIVFAAVKFMAETAKLLSPDKTVLVPSKRNGCSLADAITAADMDHLRGQYPDATFVCYINTTAAVKARCDVCVTSSNVYKIIEAIPNDHIVFVPDKLMGENILQYAKERGINKTIRLWNGTCYVHETYDPDMIHYLRQEHPGLKVVSHPECSPAVVDVSDYVGSTSQMIRYVKETEAEAYFLLTECGLAGRLQSEVSGKVFVGSCTMCRYMKANTLEDIRRVLIAPDPDDIIEIGESDRMGALRCIDAMFAYS